MQAEHGFNISGREYCFRYECMLRFKCFEIVRVSVNSVSSAIHHGKILLTDAVRRHVSIMINIIDDACIHRPNVLTR